MIKVIDKGILNKVQVNAANHIAENSSIQILGNNNEVYVESRCSFKDTKIIVRGNNNKIFIRRGARFLGGAISLASFCELDVGERSSFGSRLEVVIISGKVSVGNDCVIDSGLMLRTADTHGIYDLSTNELINKAADVKIGDYVWIGKNVTILRGAEVAACNMIATDSVFVKRSEPFEIWGGVPAKKIRDNVLWSKSSMLENIEEDKYAEMYIEKYKLAKNRHND